MNRRAFTLIELLAVIATIAIVASMMLAAVSSAKAKVRQTICVAEAKQWAVAMLMYADDYDNAIPRENAGGGDVSEVVAAEENGDVWYNALAPYACVRPARLHIIGNETSDSFYERLSLFCCPSAKPLAQTKRSAPRFSRGMNAKLMGSKKFQTVTAITDPSITVAFAEVGVPGEAHLATQALYKGRPHVKWDHTSMRHGGKGNVSFFDGSARLLARAVLTNEFTTVMHWTADGLP